MPPTRTGFWKYSVLGLAFGALVWAGAWFAAASVSEAVDPVVSSLVPGCLGAALGFGLFLFLAWDDKARRSAFEVTLSDLRSSQSESDKKNVVLSKLARDLEHALTERNHRLGEVFEGMPGEVLWVSRDLRYVRVNSQLALAEGLYPRDFEGRPVGFTGRELSKKIRQAVQEFFGGEKSSYQLLLTEPFAEGPQEARMVSMRKFRNGEDAIVLTQTFSGAADLGLNTNVAAGSSGLPSARLASLGEMVAGIAHEINNPLAIINGRVQILRTKAVSGQLSSEELLLALEKLSQTVFRVSKIITGLRSFVRPGTGEQPEDIVPVRAIEDALDFCKGRFHKQNTRIVLEVTSTRLVRCVPVQLSQILLNLLNNSLHALDATTGEKWVRIEAHDVGDSVVFKVVDSGQGVAEEISERIFEPFFTTKDFSKGTGLGLSISRGLAETNGGMLSISRKAANTTFLLTLPSIPDNGGNSKKLQSEVEPEDVPQ